MSAEFMNVDEQYRTGSLTPFQMSGGVTTDEFEARRGTWGWAPKPDNNPETNADRLADPVVQAAIAGALYDIAVMGGESPKYPVPVSPAPVAAGELALSGVSQG